MLQVLSEANQIFFGCHLKLTFNILSVLPRVLHCKFYALCHFKLEKSFCSPAAFKFATQMSVTWLHNVLNFPVPPCSNARWEFCWRPLHFLKRGEPWSCALMSCDYSHVWLPWAAAFALYLTNMHDEGCVLKLRFITITMPCPFSLLVVWQAKVGAGEEKKKEKRKLFDCETNLNGNMHVCGATATSVWRVGQREGWGPLHPLASFLSLRAALIRGTEADTVPRGGPDFQSVRMQTLFSCRLSIPFCFCCTLFNSNMCLHAVHLHRTRMKGLGSFGCCK